VSSLAEPAQMQLEAAAAATTSVEQSSHGGTKSSVGAASSPSSPLSLLVLARARDWSLLLPRPGEIYGDLMEMETRTGTCLGTPPPPCKGCCCKLGIFLWSSGATAVQVQGTRRANNYLHSSTCNGGSGAEGDRRRRLTRPT
jgi:hypothetical protein